MAKNSSTKQMYYPFQVDSEFFEKLNDRLPVSTFLKYSQWTYSHLCCNYFLSYDLVDNKMFGSAINRSI